MELDVGETAQQPSVDWTRKVGVDDVPSDFGDCFPALKQFNNTNYLSWGVSICLDMVSIEARSRQFKKRHLNSLKSHVSTLTIP